VATSAVFEAVEAMVDLQVVEAARVAHTADASPSQACSCRPIAQAS